MGVLLVQFKTSIFNSSAQAPKTQSGVVGGRRIAKWRDGELPSGKKGFTLIELVLVLAIVAALVALGSVVLTSVFDRARNNQTITDIYLIENLILRYELDDGGLPDSLDDTEAADMRDPWGNPYQYTNLADAPKNPAGKPMVPHRKDKFLNPINTDYDLYSSGKDGESRQPLTAKPSLDDIVRASNGAFVGLAVNY